MTDEQQGRFRRLRQEEEAQQLHPAAKRSAESGGRRESETECPIRTAFQRDRDRIIHCKAFRRLARKTQVFLNPQGDHYRTRITHTLEVSQIARTITRALKLNEDLSEAIALSHDLGHTPFGHAGEAVLAGLVDGGFRHAEQSLRVVDVLERPGRGLNLTFEVRDGIVRHSKGKGPIMPDGTDSPVRLPQTVEGQVVRVADIIAYANHDLDDAMRGQVFTVEDLPAGIVDVLGRLHSGRIAFLVQNVLTHTDLDTEPRVRMGAEALEALGALRDFLWANLYEDPVVHGQFNKARQIMESLWERFTTQPEEFFENRWPDCPEDLRTPVERAVVDFMAGMTDRYAIRLFEEFYLPKAWWIL